MGGYPPGKRSSFTVPCLVSVLPLKIVLHVFFKIESTWTLGVVPYKIAV